MVAFPLNQLLNAIERHIALSGPRAGELMVYFSEADFSIGIEHTSTHCTNHSGQNEPFKPISERELSLLKNLEIKAKMGKLSEEEKVEYTNLRKLRNYDRLKKMYPHFSHEDLVLRLNME